MCQSNRRQDWALRLREELVQHESAIFITLTYNDESIFLDGNVYKSHFQTFLKNFRERVRPTKVRFYAVGEYGSKYFRPHYHAILFGIDASVYDILVDTWNEGFVHLGEVNEASIMYVAKYHVNKTHYPAGLNPPFVLMSLKPGIGSNYVDRMAEFHSESIDRCYVPNFEKKQRMPRYFKNKLYDEGQREEINIKNQTSDRLDKFKEKFLQNNPKGNFYLDRQARYEEFKRLYKQKTNNNDKL